MNISNNHNRRNNSITIIPNPQFFSSLLLANIAFMRVCLC